jgi:glycosyltransferase involved in cell wall biosynthesis
MIPPRHGLPHPVPSLAHSSSTSNRPTLVIPISATAGVLAGILAWIESLDFDAYGPRIIVIAEQAVPADALERVRQLTRASSTFLLEVAGRGDLAALLNAATAHAAPAHVLICIPPYYPDLAWITRFADAAMSERRAGIMHALPNAGEHPFWTPITPTASPDSRDWTEARSIAASVNKSMRPEAYGFFARCFYVGRQCLEQVGGFDAGDQSSEEFIVEDFAMRAHRGGWATVVAADVLAPAMESTTRQPARLLRSRDALERRYPGYTDQAERPLPLLQAQRRIEEARLSEAAARPAILFVTLALGGGVARRVREEIAATRNAGFRAIQLKPNSMRGSEGWCELAVDDRFESPLEYLLPLEIDQLRSFLKSIGVVEVLIHHILGLPPVVLDIPALLSVPFKIIIHDYIWFCPRTNLIRDDRYCNEPDVTECNACVQAHGSFLEPGLSPESLRHRSLKLFERAAQVIVPSADTAARMHRHFPTLQTLTSAWEVVPPPLATPYEASRASLKKKIRVAVIGSIGIQKGFNLLEAAAKDAAQNDLPIEFVVVGHSFDDARLANTGRIAVTGEFLEPEIDTMLRGVACDIAFFPSIWPETWCYALTHAMRAGLPILASSLGAFRERLTNYPDAGFFDPASATPHQINCQLIELARKLCDWLDPRGQDASPAAEELSDAVRPSGIGLGEVETNPRSAVVTSQSVVPVSDTGRPALTSTVQVLSLAEGIYAFTVRGSATSAWRENEILVPAIRILPAPFAKQKARLTILSSPAAVDDWLTKPGDVVVAQITGGTAHLLLTSLSLPNTIPLSIDVRKLDQPAEIALPRPQEAPPPVRSAPAPVTSEPQPRTSIPQAAIQAPEVRSPATAATSQRKMLRAQILAHIQNRGDVPFVGGAWAGFLGQRLWIEAFAITLLEGPGKDALEYKGRTAGGFETPWLSNGAWCGTRGMGVPLIEFALRLKPQLALTHECEYSGSFFSGAVVGPTREGLPCRSATANDPLEAIQIRLTERAVPGGLSAGSYIASAAP